MNATTVSILLVLVAGLAAAGTALVLRGRVPAPAATPPDDRVLHAFRSLSARAMHEQSEQLLRVAESRYQSLERTAEANWRAQGESLQARLGEYAARLAQLEEQRQRESAVLANAVRELRASSEQVRDEARGLAGALKDNSVRGSWGEMQLRRVLEQSGMVAHADFVEQQGVSGADRRARPDVVVRLPNGRCVVIDAKAPLDSYLRAADCDDAEQRVAHRDAHGRAVAAHVSSLAGRGYEELVPGAVDFVVMFIPGDGFLAAAFDARPELLEEAARQNVILASPSTLIAFLRGVACGWRERRVAEEAQAIAELGRQLHERVAVFAEHFAAVGTSLERSVVAYNQAVGSMERRLLVTARRFEDLGAGSARSIAVPAAVDEVPSSPPQLAAPLV